MSAVISNWYLKNDNGTTADITIEGTGFGATQYPIQINSVAITVATWSDTLVTGTVPSSALDPSVDGQVKINATDAMGFIEAKVAKSVVTNAGKIELAGDSATPGNNKFYGTNSAGTKGFFDMSASASGFADIDLIASENITSNSIVKFRADGLTLEFNGTQPYLDSNNGGLNMLTLATPAKYGYHICPISDSLFAIVSYDYTTTPQINVYLASKANGTISILGSGIGLTGFRPALYVNYLNGHIIITSIDSAGTPGGRMAVIKVVSSSSLSLVSNTYDLSTLLGNISTLRMFADMDGIAYRTKIRDDYNGSYIEYAAMSWVSETNIEYKIIRLSVDGATGAVSLRSPIVTIATDVLAGAYYATGQLPIPNSPDYIVTVRASSGDYKKSYILNTDAGTFTNFTHIDRIYEAIVFNGTYLLHGPLGSGKPPEVYYLDTANNTITLAFACPGITSSWNLPAVSSYYARGANTQQDTLSMLWIASSDAAVYQGIVTINTESKLVTVSSAQVVHSVTGIQTSSGLAVQFTDGSVCNFCYNTEGKIGVVGLTTMLNKFETTVGCHLGVAKNSALKNEALTVALILPSMPAQVPGATLTRFTDCYIGTDNKLTNTVVSGRKIGKTIDAKTIIVDPTEYSSLTNLPTA